MFTSKTPDLKQLNVIGSRCEVLDEKLPRSAKMESRSKTKFLLGYTETGYRIIDGETKVTDEVCHVRIYNTELYKDFYPGRFRNSELVFEQEKNESETATLAQAGGGEKALKASTSHDASVQPTLSHVLTPEEKQNYPSLEEVEIECDWDLDDDKPITQKLEMVVNSTSLGFPSYTKSDNGNMLYDKDLNFWREVPLTYTQAMSPKYATKWRPALEKEKQAMLRHKVWEIVDQPRNVPVLPVKWILTEKSDGIPKARIVVIGSCDKEKYTLDETASPTHSAGAFRWFILHAAHFQWDLKQLDVTNAYLHARIKKDKYISIPPGFDNPGKNKVGKLCKNLYGLATSPVNWFEEVEGY